MNNKTIARFWAKVDRRGPIQTHRPELGPCWVWTAYRDRNGYGQFGMSKPRRLEYAHRIAWMLKNGAIGEEDACVLHACDNPACCNPEHLFLGTRADNMVDMLSKNRYVAGRKHRGEKNGNAKLTEAVVRAARASKESTVALAKRYGVSQSSMHAAVRGKTWKHV